MGLQTHYLWTGSQAFAQSRWTAVILILASCSSPDLEGKWRGVMQWPATLLWWRLQLFLIWVCWSKPIIIPKRRTGPQCRHLGCLSPYASGCLILTVSVIHTCSLVPTQSLSSLSILTRFSSRINISLEAPVSSRKCDPAPTPVCLQAEAYCWPVQGCQVLFSTESHPS